MAARWRDRLPRREPTGWAKTCRHRQRRKSRDSVATCSLRPARNVCGCAEHRARARRAIRSMDVQCERCKTEYEFDDALVSGRGTTVRCTHCGHQFKVRRPDVVDATGDRWVVRTASGPQLTFLTLRELQRAILAKQVSRS